MNHQKETKQPAERLLIDAAEYARLLSVGERTLWRLDASGRIPAAIRLGRAKRWRREEVEAHVAAGMPPRECWVWPAPTSPAVSGDATDKNGREKPGIRGAGSRSQ